jgi:hypothetical protein
MPQTRSADVGTEEGSGKSGLKAGIDWTFREGAAAIGDAKESFLQTRSDRGCAPAERPVEWATQGIAQSFGGLGENQTGRNRTWLHPRKERSEVSATIDQRLPIGTVRNLISARLREVRMERFGVHGGPELADQMGLPARSWADYENGVAVPAEVMLVFLEITGCSPRWLLSGEGPRYPADLREIAGDANRSRVESLSGDGSLSGLHRAISPSGSSDEVEKAVWEGNRRELRAEIDRLRMRVAEAMNGGGPGARRLAGRGAGSE